MLDATDARNLFENLPDLEPITLLQRTSATTPSGSDTFTAYSLYYAKRLPATRQQADMAGISLTDESLVWLLQQWDLDNSIALNYQPYATYALVDQTLGTQNGSITSTSTSVTGLASTTGLLKGMGVVGTGIPAGTTIAVVNSSTALTLSNAATATNAAASLTFGVVWLVERMERSQTKDRWTCTCRRGR